MIKYGLIPAAGRGLRAYPKNKFIPKSMFEIEGEPLILNTLNILRHQMGIKNIFVILGYLGNSIKEFLKDGKKYDVNINYITCPDPSIGLARGMLLVKGIIDDTFITILGDELYYNSNHKILLNTINERRDFNIICGVRAADSFREIKKNYSVQLQGEEIVFCEEKPKNVVNNLMGCGTYVFTPNIFNFIENTPPSLRSGKIELSDVINKVAQEQKKVYACHITGEYVNINTVEDYNMAVYKVKTVNWPGYKVSVIIPAYNEEMSIGEVIKDFKPWVSEVIVVNNCSIDNTENIANNLGAKVISKKLAGYGDALRCGMDNASGDILILTEADGSFRAKDLPKILEYLKDADIVIGTRTTRQLAEQGTNMKGIVRWVDVLFGKFVELLWWYMEPRFTDVGCTYRGIWKDVYTKMKEALTSNGPEFSVEMMTEILRERRRIIEIPVSYYPRFAGESKHSKNIFKLTNTALRMFSIILKERFGK